jgi:(1->4)-alpha-D-glucan 1-alpha-D-glucosylmutase
LIAEGRLQGLRLDHIDGLRDPAQYFVRLRRLVREAQGGDPKPFDSKPFGSKSFYSKSFYVVVEKILGEEEKLHTFAGVHGTTGYEWMNVLTHLQIDPKGLDALDEIWRQISNRPPRLAPVLLDAKRRVLETLLTSEFTVLSRLLARIAGGHYSTRDYSADSLRQALELYVLHFPVYRTYLTGAAPSEHDRELISRTIDRARADWFAADEGIFDFLRDTLTMDLIKRKGATHSPPRVRRFALKVQQFTGPLMAKSLEDTAFYRYHRLLALNEVGGDPSADSLPIERFHEIMQARAREWPHGMTATATHDTKRGEDARARLAALTELSSEWTSAAAKWKVLNAQHLVTSGNMRAPSVTTEYMLYQTLLGAWPLEGPDDTFVERIQAYALKAVREGKEETSWLNPNEGYEAGLKTFIGRILDRSASAEFLESLARLAQPMALLGTLNSLSQITLKATLPGVPDFYQGTEFWDLSLVDPDNRRPVDFAVRASTLAAMDTPDWQELARNWQDGRIKLAWIAHVLRLRNELTDVFTDGDYEPLDVSGLHRDHVIAFARRRGKDAAIIAAARLFAPFTQAGRVWPIWETLDATIALGGLSVDGVDAGGELPLSTLFQQLPVAVLKARAEAAVVPSRKRGRA